MGQRLGMMHPFLGVSGSAEVGMIQLPMCQVLVETPLSKSGLGGEDLALASAWTNLE